MISVYVGRDCLDKEAFIFDEISSSNRESIVIVPDQYSLEAERQGIKRTGGKPLINTEILSFSRLGYSALNEQGGRNTVFINKYGRHILLYSILSGMDDLQTFAGLTKNNSFVAMVNDFITSMKNEDIGSKDVAEWEEAQHDPTIARKLHDMAKIFRAYEDAIEGKYTDGEDMIRLFSDKIVKSQRLAEKDVWIYGFDSFSERLYSVIAALNHRCISSGGHLNVILTGDLADGLFKPSEKIIEKLRNFGDDVEVAYISDEYKMHKPDDLSAVEVNVLAERQEVYEGEVRNVHLVRANNLYNEAEAAAAHVANLIYSRKYRYRDIGIVCNDIAGRGSILKRVFGEYGLSLFMDEKKPIINEPLILFVLSLVQGVESKFANEYILRNLKSRFSGLTFEEAEELENYSIRFKIRGTMWASPFKLGGELSENPVDMDYMNNLRERLISPFIDLRDIVRSGKKKEWTYRDFCKEFYNFVISLDLPVDDDPVWKGFVNILDQLVELLGDKKFELTGFSQLLATGLSQIKVGVLPPSVDDLILGTTMRTRTGPIKAMVVIGANEGVMPPDSLQEGLFSRDELKRISKNVEYKPALNKPDLMEMEEKLGIYRNFSKPTEDLWISYAISDDQGGVAVPSAVVDDMLKYLPKLNVEGDFVGQDIALDMTWGRGAVLRHLTKALSLAAEGQKISPVWQEVAKWYSKENPEDMKKLLECLNFSNGSITMERTVAEKLLGYGDGKPLKMTPYKIEAYSQCPFKYFFKFGLAPKERRKFQVDSRELGTFYHKIMERFCIKMDEEEKTGGKGWSNITEEQVGELVASIVDNYSRDYSERLFKHTGREQYMTKRICSLATDACNELVSQRKLCAVEASLYEVRFSDDRESMLPAEELFVGNQRVVIGGIIDRVDKLADNQVAIFDYKTGGTRYDETAIKAGYALQLFVYLQAAERQEDRKGVGVFYIHLMEKRERIPSGVRHVNEQSPSFILDGRAVENAKNAIAKELLKSTKSFIPEESMEALKKSVESTVNQVCNELLTGDISISPMRINNKTACEYCEAKDTCRFDIRNRGFAYRDYEATSD